MKQLPLIILFLIITTSSFPCFAMAGDNSIGSIVAIRGKAYAVDTEGKSRPLSLKSLLYEQDVLKTLNRTRLQMMFNDQTLISLGPESQLKISEYAWDSESKKGKIQTSAKEGFFHIMGGSIAKESPEEFKTQTPVATIGIRGSMYAFNLDEEKLDIVFLGGKGILVSTADSMIEINRPGYGTQVFGRDNAPEPPWKFSLQQMKQILKPVHPKPKQNKPHHPVIKNDPDPEHDEEYPGDYQGEHDDPEMVDPDAKPGENREDGLNHNPDDQDGPYYDEYGNAHDDPNDRDDPHMNQDGNDGYYSPDDPDGAYYDDSGGMEDPHMKPDPDGNYYTPEEPDGEWFGEFEQEFIDNDLKESHQDEFREETELAAKAALSGKYMAAYDDKLSPASGDIIIDRGPVSATLHDDGFVDGNAVVDNDYIIPFAFHIPVRSIPPGPYEGPVVFDGLTREVRFPWGDHVFGDMTLLTSDMGEFAVFHIGDIAPGPAENPFYSETGFVGLPALAQHRPDDGIFKYTGPMTGFSHYAPDSNPEYGSLDFKMLVNWNNNNIMGAVEDTDQGESPVFFYGRVDPETSEIASLNFMGYMGSGEPENQNAGPDNTMPADDFEPITWMAGNSTFGRFYGTAYQGVGFEARGEMFEIASLQNHDMGIWGGTGGGLRDENVIPVKTGTDMWQGFVVGMSENMNNPEENRRIFANNASDDFTLNINRDDGVIKGKINAMEMTSESDVQSEINIGGELGSAYIDDHLFIAELGTDNGIQTQAGSTGTKPYGNYMVTDIPNQKFSEYLTWGYWEINYDEPGEHGAPYHTHMPGSMWVAGRTTPVEKISELIGYGFSGSYHGSAVGAMVMTDPGAGGGGMVPLNNGTVDLNIHFSPASDTPVTGAIEFAEQGIYLGIEQGSVGVNGFQALINDATHSAVNGAFYGANAEAVGGNFIADFENHKEIVGVFGAVRK